MNNETIAVNVATMTSDEYIIYRAQEMIAMIDKGMYSDKCKVELIRCCASAILRELDTYTR